MLIQELLLNASTPLRTSHPKLLKINLTVEVFRYLLYVFIFCCKYAFGGFVYCFYFPSLFLHAYLYVCMYLYRSLKCN